MSKFKVEFLIKQHTPIIHFQSDQKGATLRGTELKPKLDKFLIEYVFENDKSRYQEFLISGQENALDYKVSISEDLSAAQEIGERNPLFFGNMGDGKDKKFKQNPNGIKVSLFSYKTDLVAVLSENFEAFLANTNFGTRQSKGFGSFYTSGSFNKSLVKHKVYSFSSSDKKWDEDIKHFYSFLRAGINTASFRGIYAKAVIFSYAKIKGITWDKKAIKKRYMHSALETQQDKYFGADTPLNYDAGNEKIVRDLFGLSSSQNWMSYRATVTKDDTETDTKKKMARFKSPITFKPIKEGQNMKIYFWADKSVEQMLNKEFLIKVNNAGDLRLSTPANFSFEEFFEYAFDLDLSGYVDSQFHGNSQYETLVKMFREIKESK